MCRGVMEFLSLGLKGLSLGHT